jgi:chemotaxis family two-component system response regulator Rcp1
MVPYGNRYPVPHYQTRVRQCLRRYATEIVLPFALAFGEVMMSPNGSGPRPLDVLLVEDSPGDVRLTQEAFRNANSSIRLHVASDGIEAMSFLNRRGANAASPRPHIVLLDLNMPRMDGREVLAHIKADDDLKSIPTIILTTSDTIEDIEKTYQLRANCYLCKPVQLEEFEDLVNCINDFWLTRAKLPVEGGIG